MNNRALLEELKRRARHLKSETLVLSVAARDPRTPWVVKALVAGIVAYAFSPIDLIPDFVPILGHVDDLILIPLGIALAIKLIPEHILSEARARVQETERPKRRVAGVIIVGIWILLAVLCTVKLFGILRKEW